MVDGLELLVGAERYAESPRHLLNRAARPLAVLAEEIGEHRSRADGNQRYRL
jgi:hypothetical protein